MSYTPKEKITSLKFQTRRAPGTFQGSFATLHFGKKDAISTRLPNLVLFSPTQNMIFFIF